MLEKIDLSKKMNRTDFKAAMEETDAKLGRLQRACRENKIPIQVYNLANPDDMVSAMQGENVGTLVTP